VYFPPERSTPHPTIVLFHGGGWIMGSIGFNDQMARSLCLGTNSVVVSSGYRLAPEHQFPAAVDDASAAVRWAFENVGDLGGDPQRIGVAGISAGANLAAVAALDAVAAGLELAVQVLVVPTLDAGREYPSKLQNAEGYLLTAKDLEFSNETYCPTSRGLDRDPRRSPLYASHDTLARTAPAVISVSEHDVVRDEGLAYANRLREAGNPPTTLYNTGLVHNVSDVFTTVPSVRRALEAAWDAARDVLGETAVTS
jgi:acetyl esterase